jgi:hypothetical protein
MPRKAAIQSARSFAGEQCVQVNVQN